MNKVKVGNWYHMAISDLALIRHFQEDGAGSCLQGFEGTDQEAIAEVRADSQDFYTMGECENENANGSCGGHTK